MSDKPIRISREAARRHTEDMTGKNIVITGATAGVGKETAKSLAKMGANIYFATRNPDKTRDTIAEIRAGLTNGSVLEHKPLDLNDLDSVRQFPSLFGDNDHIDVLINNAGVAHETGVTKQGIERIFGINYLGHFLLTMRLMPHLQRAKGRIISVSSMGHSSARREHFDGPFHGPCENIHPQVLYGRSKAAQILFTKALQRRLDQNGRSCAAASLHPGAVRTRIFDTYGVVSKAFILMLWPIMVDVPEGARTSVYLATRDRPEESGGKYFYYGMFRKGIYEKPGTALVNDEALSEQLWKQSEELVGEEFAVG
ncbi:SDR family NAD(P)-dependent oxidoreductase [archaeon]|nr:SDR family NAD(P)-dependent oxidoreductase [archaeon]